MRTHGESGWAGGCRCEVCTTAQRERMRRYRGGHERPLTAIRHERGRQDAKWGEQNHPDGTGESGAAERRDIQRQLVDLQAQHGLSNWADILREELYEALAEADPAPLRKELVQAGAVIVAWIEHLDRRK